MHDHMSGALLYPRSTGRGGILFYLCPSVRPKMFITFFSVIICGSNLIFGHRLQKGQSKVVPQEVLRQASRAGQRLQGVCYPNQNWSSFVVDVFPFIGCDFYRTWPCLKCCPYNRTMHDHMSYELYYTPAPPEGGYTVLPLSVRSSQDAPTSLPSSVISIERL
jgi:hypothetical protein